MYCSHPFLKKEQRWGKKKKAQHAHVTHEGERISLVTLCKVAMAETKFLKSLAQRRSKLKRARASDKTHMQIFDMKLACFDKVLHRK